MKAICVPAVVTAELFILTIVGSVFSFAHASFAAVAVLTHHYDLNRSGANLNETLLTTDNVNTNQFGLVFSRIVDDEIHTQPLIATNVAVPGKGTHNLVIVATVNDSIYAFEADDPATTAPLWQTNLLNANAVPVSNTDIMLGCLPYRDFSGKMGIVGTPVIDPDTSTIYFVARTKEFGSIFVQRLWALDIRSGTEVPNGHITIAFTNSVTFDPLIQNQRAALALVNGYIYITWSSHCDGGPYHGLVAAYRAADLSQPPITFNVTPSGTQGGIWMSDQAPAADVNGNIYLSTGNGTWDGVNNFGQSFLKLTNTGAALVPADWFTPYNWTNLNNSDLDLGSGGVLLIPGRTLLFSGGKAGWLYLVNSTNMGHISGSASADTNIVQTLSGVASIHGGAAWWDTATASYAYIWPASGNHLRQLNFSRAAGQFSLPIPFSQSLTTGGSGQPGGILSLSANGTNPTTGIVWASVNTSADANQRTVAGTLHAYDARFVAKELWNSDKVVSRDALGNFAKFVAPTVANGRVYMATFSNRLNVYGLLPLLPLTITLTASNVTLYWPTNNGGGFVLQSSIDLVNWSSVASTISASDDSYTTTVPPTNSMCFYRLKR